MINEQITFTNQKIFEKIAFDDLMKLIKKMNLKNVPEFNKMDHYHMVFKKTLHSSSQPITVVFQNSQASAAYYIRNFNAKVYSKIGHCLPKIYSEDCNNPSNPKPVLYHHSNSFNPIVKRNCSESSKLTYQWSVNHVLDTKMYDALSGETQKTIKFPPYTLWNNDMKELFVSIYSLKLNVLEVDQENKRSGMTTSRCYINVLIPKPEIRIKGGLNRDVTYKEDFIVDAGETIDYASPPNLKNPILFSWNCTSELKNKFCSKISAATPQIRVPARTFELKDKVSFYVNAKSKNTQKRATGSQELNIIEDAPLYVWTKCVKNCGKNFLQHEIYHAVVYCENCNKKDLIEYQWNSNGVNLTSSSRVIILPNQHNLNSALTVTVNQNKKYGSETIDLISDTSLNGTCTITPGKGVAFVTEFEIYCNFDDPGGLEKKNRPTKSIYQNNILLTKLSSRNFKVILNEKQKDFNGIVIRVETIQGSFVEIPLDVDVENFKIDDIRKFIRGESVNNSLHDLVEFNDLPKAIAMMYLIINRMSPDDEDVAGIMLDEILNMELLDIDSIEILSGVLKQLCPNITMTYDLRGKIAKVFNKVSESINGLVEESKISHQLKIASVRNITQNMLTALNNVVKPLKMIEPYQDVDGIYSDDRFDDYEDYEDLDVNGMNKVGNLVSTTVSINRLVQSIFKCYVMLVDPEEPPETFDMYNLNFTFFEIDLKIPYENLTLNAFNTRIYFPKALMTSLKYAKSLKIGLLSFKDEHPFWWATDETQKLSNVFTLDIFTGDGLKIKDLNERFVFTSNIGNVTSNEISDCVSSKDDMPIYKIEFPAYSKLLLEINMEESYQLKFLEQIGSRPQYKDVFENSEKVKIIQNKTTFYVEKEIQSENEILYIALLAHQNNESRSCINFTLSVQTLSCDVWNEEQGPWSGKYCRPLELVNGTQLQCSCNHFSTFTSKLFVPKIFLNLPRGIVYGLEKNYTVMIMVVVSVVVFGLLFLWAWKFDENNIKKSKIIGLGSNHPNHKYYYLVTVVTGGYRKSGTSSKICIELQGSRSSSGPCMLYDNKVKFDNNSEWSFLLTVPEYLGKLEKIVIWMKPSGANNSWYCEKILVRDVARKELFSFLVENWFSLTHSKNRSDWNWIHEKLLSVEKKTQKKLFRENIFFGMKNSFLACSIFNHHPSSSYTARQRVIVMFCIFAFIMMINILFFGNTTLQNVENEQTYYQRFQIGINTLVVSLQSVVITIPLALLLEFLLNRESKKSNNVLEQNYHAVYREEKEDIVENEDDEQRTSLQL
ncbi:unnamed protein product [Diamesa tonsa]